MFVVDDRTYHLTGWVTLRTTVSTTSCFIPREIEITFVTWTSVYVVWRWCWMFVDRNLFWWCDRYWLIKFVSKPVYFDVIFFSVVSVVSVRVPLFFFWVGLLSFKFTFFTVKDVYSSLVVFLRSWYFFVLRHYGGFLVWSRDRYPGLVLLLKLCCLFIKFHTQHSFKSL